jgi:hypothetical protein
MPVQLDLLDPDRAEKAQLLWSRLPGPVRQELVELFADLLVAIVRAPRAPANEEAASEPRES